MPKASIIYSGYYDFPLAFVASHDGEQFLFVRDWNDEIDDYEDEYKVYLLPDMSHAEIESSWLTLTGRAVSSVGTIAVNQVKFDATHSLSIDTMAFSRIRPNNT